jgi:hypothetical protein
MEIDASQIDGRLETLTGDLSDLKIRLQRATANDQEGALGEDESGIDKLQEAILKGTYYVL